jgi:hypothetical protein
MLAYLTLALELDSLGFLLDLVLLQELDKGFDLFDVVKAFLVKSLVLNDVDNEFGVFKIRNNTFSILAELGGVKLLRLDEKLAVSWVIKIRML